ncbi:MAG TPA: LysR family transcriptional regulator [Candidatus Limnocylindrales bacterium]|jgi:DNA-binding transcriptional LysR family regulator|nr:LysR family transcriptional regulator [Candidatus Limnocylindrales bacterium]
MQATIHPPLEESVTVHQLRLLSAVIDQGGFSRAGDALGLSQPAVSHQLKALAETVGLPVVEVVGRQVRLTSAGAILYDHARRIHAAFAEAEEALDELRGVRRGRIRLAGDTTVGIYVLPDLLGSFHQAHPGVEVSLGVDNRQGLLDRLVDDTADFVVSGRQWPEPPIPLVVRPFLGNELIAIASPRHRLARRRRVRLAELADEPFIIREPGSGTRETTEEAMHDAGLTIHPVMELASNGAIKRAVARDLGIAVLSRYATALELRIGQLVELPVVGFPLRRRWHLVYPRDKRLGPVDEAFLGFVEDGRWQATLGTPLTTD